MIEHAVTAMPPDDAELARRIGKGDQRAFEVLMRRHNRMLFRVARSILREDAEAEDAVQEAYLAAYRAIASFRGGAALSTWLVRIVINEAKARLRKRRRAAVVVPFEAQGDEARSDEVDMSDETFSTPETAAIRGELRQLLERKIDELPAQFRTVFMLREVEEMSVEETAACLDIPAATVRTRTFRARAALRESLGAELDAATMSAFGFAGDRCDRIVAAVLARLPHTGREEAAPRGTPMSNVSILKPGGNP